MFNNIYVITINGKNVKVFLKRLYKSGINFINIIDLGNELVCKVDQKNYEKIKNIKTSYKIEVTKVYGFVYLKKIIKKNSIFLLFFLIGILYLFLLSKLIFRIDIINDDKQMNNIILEELEKNKIKKYSMIKNYSYIQNVKEKIIEKYKDKIEWIEIERIGVTYKVKYEKRIMKEEEKKENQRHVIAKKSGLIKKIEANDGEIIKKVNDYVNKGDIIISGEIHKGEDVKGNVSASGKVFAEVWYKVKVTLPINYYEEKTTNRQINTFKIKILDKDYNLFNKNFIEKKTKSKLLFSDFYDMISINYSNDKELNIVDEVNTLANENDAIILARNKILDKLDTEEYIISQKKLKTIINDSTINVEVFFKIYENISSYLYYTNEGL